MNSKFLTEKEAKKILSGIGVQCDLEYPTFLTRFQDDIDGSKEIDHQLTVSQGPDGDMYISVGPSQMLRFRTYAGGGRSLAVHNALRILAHAIKMDNENNPISYE